MNRTALGAALLVLLLSGCGAADVPLPSHLDGADVARMAERQLEAQNARLARGTLSCPDLDFRVGAVVRCLRTTRLSGGRMVKIGGTVRVVTRASGGRLHVAMDDRPQEFGMAGEGFAAGVRKEYRRRFGVDPSRLVCPYLRGVVGARVTCRVEVAGSRRNVGVVVTGVDPGSFATTYALEVRRGHG